MKQGTDATVMQTEDIKVQSAPEGFRRWPEVHALLQGSFAYMAERVDPPSSMTRLSLDGLVEKARQETCLLAMDGDSILGCAFLDRRPDCLYVGKVAVHKSARGRGIARRLFEEAERIALGSGLPCLELQSRVELTENHETFRRLGFRKSGEDAHEGYERPTSIRMRKPLGDQAWPK